MIAIFFYFWFQERIIGLSKAHLLQKEQANDSETDIEDSSIKRNDSYPTLKQSEQSPVIKKKESKCSAEKEWQISIDILTPLQKHFLKTLILSCTSEDMMEKNLVKMNTFMKVMLAPIHSEQSTKPVRFRLVFQRRIQQPMFSASLILYHSSKYSLVWW